MHLGQARLVRTGLSQAGEEQVVAMVAVSKKVQSVGVEIIVRLKRRATFRHIVRLSTGSQLTRAVPHSRFIHSLGESCKTG
jgi:hypothetical protein